MTSSGITCIPNAIKIRPANLELRYVIHRHDQTYMRSLDEHSENNVAYYKYSGNSVKRN